MKEAEIIAQLAKIFAIPQSERANSRIIVGIGDDGAVVAPSPHNWVITTDMAVEGVHFQQGWSSAYEIGGKITSANLADIFAMGATPHHLVVALSLTGNESMNWIIELAMGMNEEAQSVGAFIVGGDIARGAQITIAMTAVGEVDKPILRSGARAGDQIVLSGLPGWSCAGLYLLSNRVAVGNLRNKRSAERALAQFRAPDVRYADAVAMAGAHSLCDISDGLLAQGQQMAQASSAKFDIDSGKLSSHPEFEELKKLADEVGADIWDWVCAGGEDHVFLATGVNIPGFDIGIVKEAKAGLAGIELQGITKAPKGFTHFS